MAILNLQLIGVIILLTAGLRAQESPKTESVTEVAASPQSTTVNITAAGEFSSSIASVSIPENSTAPIQPLPIMDQSESESDSSSLENGGYPVIKPGTHDPGLRHVKAHDGFHSLKNEKLWAHWNDAFTTPKA